MELTVQQLRFGYPQGSFSLVIDRLSVAAGECIALVGPSGCGKSTLLKLLSGLLRPQAGSVRVGPHELNALGDASRRAFRIRHLGFVFQNFGLLDHLTVEENILLPGRLNAQLPLDGALRARAAALAAETGIAGLLPRPVPRLSQGEQQRVAICRALVGAPQVIFADEPTGNLDPANKRRIFELLLARARAARATLVVVTHDHSFLDRFDRTLPLLDFVRVDSP